MLKRSKVTTDQLAVGMYVAELDRPWLETPFLLQGFRIRRQSQIEELKKLCLFVYVDEQKSLQPIEQRVASVAHQSGSSSQRVNHLLASEAGGRRRAQSTGASGGRNQARSIPTASGTSREKLGQALFPGKKLQVYEDRVRFKNEIPDAKLALENLSASLREIFSRPDKSRPLDPARLKRAVAPMIDSVIRNPDACIWLAQMKRVDSYMYEHSLATSVWAVALGRQLGLPRGDLQTLAMGGLLLDIGKLYVDEKIMNHPGSLSQDEFERAMEHVEFSVEELKRAGFLNARIGEMVEHHHERYDGSGYPQCLEGDDIPVFARIAAIVDSYDAMTSNRVYAQAMAPSAAIKELYSGMGDQYQAELVQEFIQAIGIYPAGSLVELSSGEVAVVVAEYRSRRLRPQVMVILDGEKQPLKDIRIINLIETTHMEDGRPLDILHGLEAGAYDINMESIGV